MHGDRRSALLSKISSGRSTPAYAPRPPASGGSAWQALPDGFIPPPGVCHRPFSSLVTNKEGEEAALAPCCVSWLKKDGVVRRYRALGVEDISRYWTSDAMMEMRASVLDGTYRYCDKEQCPFLFSGNFREAVYTTARGDYSRDFPLVLQYGLDSSCNLYCPSCRTERVTSDPQAGYGLDLEEVLARGLRVLSANGSGEFFMNPSLLKMARTFRADKFPKLSEFCLITNGQLLTPRMWESLSEDFRGKVGSISISLDASSPDVYEKVRRGGHFSVVLSNLGHLRSLVKEGKLCEFSLGFVLCDKNFRDLPGFIDLAYRLGACLIHVSPIQDWGSMSPPEYAQAAVHLQGHPEHDEYLAVLAEASSRRKRYGLLSMGALSL